MEALLRFGASDLHIKAGRPPIFRVDGKLIPAKLPTYTAGQVDALLRPLLNARTLSELESKRSVDLSFQEDGLGRFRCNLFYQRNTLAAVFRMIPIEFPRLDALGAPAVLKTFVQRPSGLILVTGSTGMGKSTTMAALIEHLNQTQPLHILTIEDPIEFVYQDKKSTISQREVGTDTLSLHGALVAGLRQDPDVIVVGEMRDPETVRLALNAAETGHLVLSTLHTSDAKGTIERILDMVHVSAQNHTRVQLSNCLVGLVSQTLLPRADKKGRVLAAEVLVNSPAMASVIAENRLDQISELIASSSDYYQMQTLNKALHRLVRSGAITATEALGVSPRPGELEQLLAGIVRD